MPRSALRCFMAMIVLAVSSSCDDRRQESSDPSIANTRPASAAAVARANPPLAVGEPAQLWGRIPQWSEFAIFSGHIILVPTEYDLVELRAAVQAPESEGGARIRGLLETTDAFGVPNGTDVTVRRQGNGGTLVRIEEPGRVYSGKQGWVPAEWVLPRPRPAPRDPALPSYTVLEKMGTSIHVLVPSLRPTMNTDSLARVLIAITQREVAEEASFYRTRSAYDANVNGGPNQADVDRRLRQGYLGSVERAEFRPPLPF